MYVVKESNVKVEKETRWSRFKQKVGKKWDDFKYWCVRHKEEIVYSTPIVMIAVRQISKTVRAVFVTNRKSKLMRYGVYDRSEGHHWFLRRDLSNAEWYEVQARKKRGERLGDIFESMHVLK